MPAPHFSIWDHLSVGLDPRAITSDELSTLNARHALPRYKRSRFYGIVRVISWVPALIVLVWLWSSEPNPDRLKQLQVGVVVFLVLSLAAGYALGLLDRSNQLLRRRRREALIHPRERAVGTMHTERPTADVLRLSELIGQRRDYWSRRLNGYRFWDWYIFAQVNVWWAAFIPLLFYIPQLWNVLENRYLFGRSTIWFMLLMPLLIMVVIALRGRWRLRRLSRSLVHRVCPDCGYSLEDAGDATLPHAGQVLGLGPRRCTECGVPWPLLPPPKAV